MDEEIERRLQSLISRGELAAEEGLRLRDQLVRQSEMSPASRWPREADLERALDKRGVPSHQDLQQILVQLEALASKLDEMGPDADYVRSGAEDAKPGTDGAGAKEESA